ncbi:hypothetical protein [Oleispirillum naphthae]|uniref:hypothetical protein n=1 Tax=Oleispirillum naphthae TaxID=2838853 RepID=UPI0030822CD4
MSRASRLRTACLSALCLALAAAPALAGSAPQPIPFSTTKAKSSVPVTPKQTISKKNREAGIVFDDKGTLKTRKLGSGKLSKTDKTLSNIKSQKTAQ